LKKRFTDVDKWEQPWFRNLAPPTKLLWVFLLDRCDPAGVWEVDPEGFCFHTGCTPKSFKDGIDTLRSLGRISALPAADSSVGAGGFVADRLWVVKFVQFQHGKLSPQCKPHVPVFAALERHGLRQLESGSCVPKSKGYPKGMESLEVKVKGKAKAKEKGECQIDKDALINWCVKYWNEMLSCRLPKVTKLTPTRRKALVLRLKEQCKEDNTTGKRVWEEIIFKIKWSPFLMGTTSDFCASFDWVLAPRNWTKIWEGNYNKKAKPQSLTDNDHGKGF
jgi:hypothetical protein